MLKRLHPEDPRFEERTTAAEIRKLDLAELRGKTLLKNDARDLIAEEYDVVRAALRAIPRKAVKAIAALIPERIETTKIERLLKREVESSMDSLRADRTV